MPQGKDAPSDWEARLKEQVDILSFMANSTERRPRPEEIERVLENIDDCIIALEEELKKRYRKTEEEELRGVRLCESPRFPEAISGNEAASSTEIMHVRVRRQLERAEGIIDDLEKELKDRLAPWFNLRKRRLRVLERWLRSYESLQLAAALKKAREKFGITVLDAAKRMDISVSYLSQLEKAKCNPPSAKVMERINRFLREADLSDAEDITRDGERSERTEDVGGKIKFNERSIPEDEEKAKVENYSYRDKMPNAGKFDGAVERKRETTGNSRIGRAVATRGRTENYSETGRLNYSGTGRLSRTYLLRRLMEVSLELDVESLELLIRLAENVREG